VCVCGKGKRVGRCRYGTCIGWVDVAKVRRQKGKSDRGSRR